MSNFSNCVFHFNQDSDSEMPLLLSSSEPQRCGGKELQQTFHNSDTFQILRELPETNKGESIYTCVYFWIYVWIFMFIIVHFFLLQRLWAHQGHRRQERMPDSLQVPFSRLAPIWRSELVFRAMHVHVRINEPGLAIYYCAPWAVSWEPNLLSALVHSLIGHRVTFKGWCSGCSALPWLCRGQPSSRQSSPSMAVCDLEFFLRFWDVNEDVTWSRCEEASFSSTCKQTAAD